MYISKADEMSKLTKAIKNLLMSMRKFAQPTSLSRRLWTPAIQVKSVKGNQVPTLSLLKWDFKNMTDKCLLLVNYKWTGAGWKSETKQRH